VNEAYSLLRQSIIHVDQDDIDFDGDEPPAAPVVDDSTTSSMNVEREATPQPAPAAPKKRMLITNDQYVSLRSLIIFHLAAAERENGEGLEREELVDWYLESKEEEIRDTDELNYHKELIYKMLKKLVKVSADWPQSSALPNQVETG
jgi:DNA replication licensing factor MCM6